MRKGRKPSPVRDLNRHHDARSQDISTRLTEHLTPENISPYFGIVDDAVDITLIKILNLRYETK